MRGPRAFPNHFFSLFQSAAVAYEARAYGGMTELKRTLSDPSLVSEATTICARLMEGQDAQPLDLGTARGLSGSLATCAYLGFRYFEAKARGDEASAQEIASQLRGGTCDPGWINTLDDYLKYFGFNGSMGTVPYRKPSEVGADAILIKSGARIVILGDWGTGTDGAIRTAKHIHQLRPDAVVHVGDIYYSGTPFECKANFLDVLNSELDRQNTKVPVFTLAGNHDMYCGGAGYYDLIDQLNEGEQRQKASFFCLRTEDNAWQILGMDTGYHDVSPFHVASTVTYLEPEEEQWHLDRIQEYPGKTILLSHHQLFSAFSDTGGKDATGAPVPCNPKLLASYERFPKDKIAAWFWGHEHNLSIYQPYKELLRGRCVGHGAIPVLEVENPYHEREWSTADRPHLAMGHPTNPIDGVYPNGFALLELGSSGQEPCITYYANLHGVGKAIGRESLMRLADPRQPVQWLDESTPAPSLDGAKEFQAGPSKGKLAFVLGIDRYTSVRNLRVASADALRMQERLQDLGFSVHGGIDLSSERIELRFSDFVKAIEPGDTALLFYSGHGIQVSGQNYIVPADGEFADLVNKPSAWCIQRLVNRVLERQPQRCIVFLDACRDNPILSRVSHTGSRKPATALSAAETFDFAARGLAPLEVAHDAQAFIAFAAEPGKYSYEGTANNSWFTTSLLRHIAVEGLGLDALIKRIGADVKLATKGRQRPWSQSNLTQDFLFKPHSWEAVWQLGFLGAIAGFITSFFVFNDKAQYAYTHQGAGIFFGVVVGYGVWRWGRRNILAALLTVIVGTLCFELGSYFLHWTGSINDLTRSTAADDARPFFENTKLLRDVVSAAIAGPIVILGCVFSGALAAPALRRQRVFTLALLAGILVCIIFAVISHIQTSMYPGDDNLNIRQWLNRVGATLWQGALGAAIGYGLSRYVPEAGELTR